jgi:beta-galactosidase
LAAVGNANPTDVSSFQSGIRKTFRGRCLAIIRPTGRGGSILLKAAGSGIVPAQIRITVR